MNQTLRTNESTATQHQHRILTGLRDGIDRELRCSGFEQLLVKKHLPIHAGRLAVSRSRAYTSTLNSSNHSPNHIDYHEELYSVGVLVDDDIRNHIFGGIIISKSINGGQHMLVECASDVSPLQLSVVECSVERLSSAKDMLPNLSDNLLYLQ